MNDDFEDAEQRAAIAADVPPGRIGLPEDIAHYPLHLASQESTLVTGTMLAIDGGTGNILDSLSRDLFAGAEHRVDTVRTSS